MKQNEITAENGQPTTNTGEIILYQPDNSIRLEVRMEASTARDHKHRSQKSCNSNKLIHINALTAKLMDNQKFSFLHLRLCTDNILVNARRH